MKLSKNINILFLGLTLILSLISFSGVTNRTNEAVKTALIISKKSKDISFFAQFKNANKTVFVSFFKYSKHTFKTFQSIQDLKENRFYKTYTDKTLFLRAEQLHTKLFPITKYQRLYNDII